MLAYRGGGVLGTPAIHLLGRKLDSVPFAGYHIVLIVAGRETVENLETFTEALPEMA